METVQLENDEIVVPEIYLRRMLKFVVEKRLSEGWTWEQRNDQFSLLPPDKKTPMHVWCVEWFEYKDNYFVPKFALYDYEVNEDGFLKQIEDD